MTPERWQRIKSLFSKALSLTPEQQPDFLKHACPDDTQVRAEVSQLLMNQQRDSDFMEPGNPTEAPLSFSPGELAGGRFRIVRLLGRGGMGEVYEAEDTLLSERVALKAIRPEIASDRKVLTRFRHEIQLARRITHANVCRIFDLEMHHRDGASIHFLTMELLAGETLAVHLERTGPLPLEEALALARQMAVGLAAAHQCGVVHRDFKSSNVMLVPTKDGPSRAVITDFGLAHDPTARSASLTATASGKLMGTLDYMAPEQLEKGETSFRSDVYSLGLVLFEMLTGTLPFAAKTPMGSALRRLRDTAPSPRTLRPESSALWESVVAGCLERNPAKRFASASEVAMALAPSPVPVPRRRRRALLAGGVIVAAVLLGAFFLIQRLLYPPAPAAFKPVPLTSFPGLEFHPALSPNGELVAFAWDGPQRDNVDIYVKQIASGALHRVTTDPAVDSSPAWSPDGQRLAFRRVLPQGLSQIIVKSYLGGPERKIAEWQYNPDDRSRLGGLIRGANPFTRRELCWSPDGRWLVASGKYATDGAYGLFAISPDTGESRQLTFPRPISEGDADPSFSPDGRILAFTRAWDTFHSELYVVPVSADLHAGAARRITFDDRLSASPAWTPDGRSLIFAAGHREEPRRLFRIPVSRLGVPLPSAIPEELPGIGEVGDQPAISRDGRRLAYTLAAMDLNIWELRLPDHRGDPPTAASLIASTRSEVLADYSPDGKKIAFTSDRTGSYEVWLANRDGSNPVQLTSLRTRYTGDPHWSPDGKTIAFISFVGDLAQVYTVPADGGAPTRLTRIRETVGAPTWSRDGKWIYFNFPQQGARQVWKIPAQGGNPIQVTRGGGVFALESLDGKYLYYSKSKGLFSSLWKVPVAGGAETQILPAVSLGRNFAVTALGIYFVGWAGPESVVQNYRSGATIQYLDSATGKIKTVFTTQKPLYLGLSATPDGRSLLYTQLDGAESDLWLVDNFR